MVRRTVLGTYLALIVSASALSRGAAAEATCHLAIDDSGLGGITAATHFELEAIARAVPGCQVTPGIDWTEGDPVDALAINHGQRPLALVFPDWTGGIYSIVVEDTAVQNRLGPTIGTAFAEVYFAEAHPLCVPGLEEAAGRVLCQARPSGHVTYVFEGRWDGPDDVVPPIGFLSTWRIRSLMWLSVPLEDPRWVDLAGFDPGEGPALLAQVRQGIDDPVTLFKIVLYPILLRTPAFPDGLTVPDVATFVAEYGRRLTPGFAAAVRNEPNHEIRIDSDGASLAGDRIRIAPACTAANCVNHRSGIVAVSMF